MTAVERAPAGPGLLTLDTRPAIMRAALRRWECTAGIIPGYCRDPFAAKLDPTLCIRRSTVHRKRPGFRPQQSSAAL
jgi:hypothetical protein